MIAALKILKAIVICTFSVSALGYFLFRPYCDTLKQLLWVGAFGFPGLAAIFLPALRNEGPGMIPVYFAIGVGLTSVATTFLFYLDRLIAVQYAQRF